MVGNEPPATPGELQGLHLQARPGSNAECYRSVFTRFNYSGGSLSIGLHHAATMEDIIMRDTTTETTIMRRSTRITIMERMENMAITITMTVLVQPRKENMNKLPNRLDGY